MNGTVLCCCVSFASCGAIRCATGSEHLEERESAVRFAAALFSWGDVARETIFGDDEEQAA